MKLIAYVEGKETRFPEFNMYSHQKNHGNFVLVMKIENNDEIAKIENKKNEFNFNIKDNFIVLETKDIVYAFDISEKLEIVVNEMINNKIGLVFAIRNNDVIIENFRLGFNLH